MHKNYLQIIQIPSLIHIYVYLEWKFIFGFLHSIFILFQLHLHWIRKIFLFIYFVNRIRDKCKRPTNWNASIEHKLVPSSTTFKINNRNKGTNQRVNKYINKEKKKNSNAYCRMKRENVWPVFLSSSLYHSLYFSVVITNQCYLLWLYYNKSHAYAQV